MNKEICIEKKKKKGECHLFTIHKEKKKKRKMNKEICIEKKKKKGECQIGRAHV